ncbi:hypothetical protein MA13_contig00001-0321 [Edwardsiella piscicida]|nr:hypothetical protein MA13_contig00001-0321 [Edwardsiella piscicida]
MGEYIVAAAGRTDKAKAFGVIKPLYGTRLHAYTSLVTVADRGGRPAITVNEIRLIQDRFLSRGGHRCTTA